ncbi:hypothetical protein EDD27_7161 [Nonomuraea polychroma]|uniref:Homeodomain-like domain-containing protein n=1 Tax=Nonomuraea polychroma TaxID=46176 RepID=A0A438MF34_9ACTN|nr:hypothetical protein [Nonomuraea polychroma]RVX44429.1 hypothetical protein EDD27_7161 [Nonomuraea polychroma]
MADEQIRPAVVDLETLGKMRADALRTARELTEQIRLRIIEEVANGGKEATLARRAGVDRMTVRTWLGKGPNAKGTAA